MTQPKYLEEIKNKIYSICTYHSEFEEGTSGYSLSEEQFEKLFDLFEEAEERGEKRIIKQMEYKFRNAEKNLNQPLTLALIKQAIRELKFELTHKSTKGK